MEAGGMGLSKQIGPEFQAFDFKYDQHTYEVFRGGSGPAVLGLPDHERMTACACEPGIRPGSPYDRVLAFLAEQLRR